MSIFENFEKKLQAEPKSIVFTEGTDARILSAASRLLAGKTLKVILLGEVASKIPANGPPMILENNKDVNIKEIAFARSFGKNQFGINNE